MRLQTEPSTTPQSQITDQLINRTKTYAYYYMHGRYKQDNMGKRQFEVVFWITITTDHRPTHQKIGDLHHTSTKHTSKTRCREESNINPCQICQWEYTPSLGHQYYILLSFSSSWRGTTFPDQGPNTYLKVWLTLLDYMLTLHQWVFNVWTLLSYGFYNENKGQALRVSVRP